MDTKRRKPLQLYEFSVLCLLKLHQRIYIKFNTATKSPTPFGVGLFVVADGFERPVQANSPVDCLPGRGFAAAKRIRLLDHRRSLWARTADANRLEKMQPNPSSPFRILRRTAVAQPQPGESVCQITSTVCGRTLRMQSDFEKQN